MADPGTFDLKVFQGDDHRWLLSFKERDADGVVTPKDLTGYVFTAQIRKRDADSDQGNPPLAELVVNILDAVAGEVEVLLPSETSALLMANAKWDLQGDLAGWIETYVAGDVILRKEVTRG